MISGNRISEKYIVIKHNKPFNNKNIIISFKGRLEKNSKDLDILIESINKGKINL